jgi:peptidoglycan/xylan/chitin deacetylase (PgdA/CDA1 family)
MRKGFENFAMAGALAAGLMGESEAVADKSSRSPELQMPHEFNKNTLPIKVLPGDLKTIKEIGHLPQLLAEELKILEQQAGCTGSQAFEVLDPVTKDSLSKSIFETTRMYGAAARNSLIGQESLDAGVASTLNQYVQKLGAKNIHCKDYPQLTGWIKSHKKSELYKLYASVNDVVAKYKEGGQVHEAVQPTHEAPPVMQGSFASPLSVLGELAPPARPAEMASSRGIKKEGQPPHDNQYLSRHNQQAERFPGTFFVEGTVKELEGKPTINLTFDDGPDTRFTPAILDIIAKYNQEHGTDIRVTFYVQGVNITKATEPILQRIVAEGHEVALHSFDHSNLKSSANTTNLDQTFQKHIARVNGQLKALGLPESHIFRPPFGNITDEEVKTFAAHNITVSGWGIDTHDWESKNNQPQQIAERVTKNAYGGAVALMHSGGGDRTNTVLALPSILDDLNRRGYKLVTTSTILGRAIPRIQEAVARHELAQVQQPRAAAVEAPPQLSNKIEYGELPVGADGFDSDGQPYGFNFQGFTYDVSHLDLSDIRGYDPKLSPPTEYQLGIATNGRPIKAYLKPDAYQAFMELATEFQQTALDPELQQMGLHVTEALRDNERQQQLRRELGVQAALPGKSEHLLGKTFDLTNGNNAKMYEWAMEPQKALANKNYVPRMVRHGYVPTIKKETWHFRYIGVEKAKAYWTKHRVEIIDNHTKLLRNEFVVPKLTT